MYGDYDDKDLHGMMRGQDDGESAYYNGSPRGCVPYEDQW